MEKRKKFYVREDQSLESVEIVNIIKAKGFDVETLKCSKDDVKQFFADLQKLVENGVTPVLVGRKCQDNDGSFFNLSTKVPEGVVLLLETAKDKPLLQQVAKIVDVHLTSSQKLLGLMNKLSFAELRNKGYGSQEIIACFDKQYLMGGGKQADIFDLRQAVEAHRGTFPLVEVTIPIKKELELLPAYVGKLAYYSGKEPSILVSFSDENTLPVFVGKNIPNALKRFKGHTSAGMFFLEDKNQIKGFTQAVRKMFA